jgi:hypothetical protein
MSENIIHDYELPGKLDYQIRYSPKLHQFTIITGSLGITTREVP